MSLSICYHSFVKAKEKRLDLETVRENQIKIILCFLNNYFNKKRNFERVLNDLEND
jgi:hypothetical protein